MAVPNVFEAEILASQGDIAGQLREVWVGRRAPPKCHPNWVEMQESGALGEIRTPDPQTRSLVL
jgi:hypothetical protein